MRTKYSKGLPHLSNGLVTIDLIIQVFPFGFFFFSLCSCKIVTPNETYFNTYSHYQLIYYLFQGGLNRFRRLNISYVKMNDVVDIDGVCSAYTQQDYLRGIPKLSSQERFSTQIFFFF